MATPTLDNDHARSWLDDLRRDGDAGTVEQVLRAVLEEERSEVDVAEAHRALAAAEVVAAALGHPAEDGDSGLRRWTDDHPQVGTLAPIARRAVDRVAQPGTELREQVFADEERARVFTELVDGLRTRLTP
jgi:hypothetical protein